MNTYRRMRHAPEQIVKKLRDADAMLNAGEELADFCVSAGDSRVDRFGQEMTD